MEEAVEPLKHINEARKRHETPECQKGCFHHLGSHSGLQALLHPERPWGSWWHLQGFARWKFAWLPWLEGNGGTWGTYGQTMFAKYSANIYIYHGPLKPTFLEVFSGKNMVFRWPKPLFFMVLGAHGIQYGISIHFFFIYFCYRPGKWRRDSKFHTNVISPQYENSHQFQVNFISTSTENPISGCLGRFFFGTSKFVKKHIAISVSCCWGCHIFRGV